ncbi:hypothetical protein C4K01_3392 [Pseudomonas synxantha]|nr:hypothetical protein C4K01_3392 [Pseudomonas synxantha]
MFCQLDLLLGQRRRGALFITTLAPAWRADLKVDDVQMWEGACPR